MTLDEAIEHAKNVASTCDDEECAADHLQLANWLTDLRMHRESELTSADEATRGENATLRALVRGLLWCDMENADACDCPLYDENEEYRCKKERLLREVGIEVPNDAD